MFFQQTAKCLGCRRSMPGFKGPIDEAPGLCEDCTRCGLLFGSRGFNVYGLCPK